PQCDHRASVCTVHNRNAHPFYLFSFPFFFTATSPTEIYTLSLHDALPIFHERRGADVFHAPEEVRHRGLGVLRPRIAESREPRVDRKSTRLNSSHRTISYAVFCLKKKKNKQHYKSL